MSYQSIIISLNREAFIYFAKISFYIICAGGLILSVITRKSKTAVNLLMPFVFGWLCFQGIEFIYSYMSNRNNDQDSGIAVHKKSVALVNEYLNLTYGDNLTVDSIITENGQPPILGILYARDTSGQDKVFNFELVNNNKDSLIISVFIPYVTDSSKSGLNTANEAVDHN